MLNTLNKRLSEVTNLFEVESLAISQINLDNSVLKAAQKSAIKLKNSDDAGDREFANRIFSETTIDLYRILCPFTAVATTINVLEKQRLIQTKNIAVAVQLALENHRAPVKKDPNPSDRYYFGQWWSCNYKGFLHQAALPLARAYGYNMISIEYDKQAGLADLISRIEPGSSYGLCLSVENQSYLHKRYGDLMEVRGQHTFYKWRTEKGLSPVKLIPDTHLISVFEHQGKFIIADSFDLPTSEETNATLAYEVDPKVLEESITGKALLLSKQPIFYKGKIIEMRLPDGLLGSLKEIKECC